MQSLKRFNGQFLTDANGLLVGAVGLDGKEYLFSTIVNSIPATAQPTQFVPSSVAITGGTINTTTIGVTTPAIVKASDYQAATADISGTAGNGTASTARGRAAFAAAANSVVITSALVTATSSIFVQLNTVDTTLKSVSVVAAAGSFTITGNAAATAITAFDFHVIN